MSSWHPESRAVFDFESSVADAILLDGDLDMARDLAVHELQLATSSLRRGVACMTLARCIELEKDPQVLDTADDYARRGVIELHDAYYGAREGNDELMHSIKPYYVLSLLRVRDLNRTRASWLEKAAEGDLDQATSDQAQRYRDTADRMTAIAEEVDFAYYR